MRISTLRVDEGLPNHNSNRKVLCETGEICTYTTITKLYRSPGKSPANRPISKDFIPPSHTFNKYPFKLVFKDPLTYRLKIEATSLVIRNDHSNCIACNGVR